MICSWSWVYFTEGEKMSIYMHIHTEKYFVDIYHRMTEELTRMLGRKQRSKMHKEQQCGYRGVSWAVISTFAHARRELSLSI